MAGSSVVPLHPPPPVDMNAVARWKDLDSLMPELLAGLRAEIHREHKAELDRLRFEHKLDVFFGAGRLQ
jgi:hypothetical protein